jgi:RNA polymerase sigma-70 factor (ECF subfamily)
MTESPPTNCDKNADDLVIRARVEREAFGELYDITYPQVFRYCLRRSGNRNVAEDITSAVFLKVAGGISNFAGATYEEFRRWSFTIATNEINADYRKTTRQSSLLKEAKNSRRLRSNVCVESINETEEHDALQAAIMKLGDRAQSLVALRYFSGLSYEDIALILNITTGTARTATSRALEELRRELGNNNELK